MSVFLFPGNNFNKYLSVFHQTWYCIDIIWRSGLELLMGKFRQFLTELSAHHMIVTGCYHSTFLLQREKSLAEMTIPTLTAYPD